jgi:hypothetical protein
VIGPDELAWLAVLRSANPRFDFTDPPFRQSLAMTLALASTGNRPTTVLTGPRHRIGARSLRTERYHPTDTYDMIPVRIEEHP